MDEGSLWGVITYWVGFIPCDVPHLKITYLITAGPFLLNIQGKENSFKIEIHSMLKQVSQTGERNFSTLF